MIVFQKKVKLRNSAHVRTMLKEVLNNEDQIGQEREHFWAIGLNSKNVVQFIELVHMGTANSCVVHPREVFRWAVSKGSISLIIAHNHPSGEVDPSTEDKQITAKLKEGGEILGIKLVDHIIINNLDDRFFSFLDHGLLR